MKILLGVDGSACSEAAIQEVKDRPWPRGTVVRVVGVAHASIPMIADPTMTGLAMHEQSLDNAREEAEKVASAAVAVLADRKDLGVTSAVLDGDPKHVLVDEAAGWKADLLVVGSHGRGVVGRLLLGSVSHAVALHAPCSVEIVRCGKDMANNS